MSIFGNIMSAIFKSSAPAATAPSSAPASASPAGPAPAAAPAASGAQAAGSAGTATLERPAAPAHEQVDVAAVLTKLASQHKEKLDWRRSIVDLMKLLNLDSSLAARKQLAKELRYTGDTGDSAEMNMWLHRQVMHKLAENGGKVPADLMGPR